MTVVEALNDTADTLDALSHRPSLHDMAPGRTLLAEVARLRNIGNQIDPDIEYIIPEGGPT
jgi:hypothetical protein